MATIREKGRRSSAARFSKSKSSIWDPKGSTLPLTKEQDEGLGCRFFEKLQQHQDKINQVDATNAFTETNGSVRLRSIKVAMEMQDRGLKENDIVMICSRSHCDQTIVVLATLLVGAILAPLDPETNPSDFKTCVLELKPKMAFCDIRPLIQLEGIAKDSQQLQNCVFVLFGHGDQLMFEKFLNRKPDMDFKPVVVKDTKRRVAFIVPTQCTAGPTKLVCLSHNAIRIEVQIYGRMMLRNAEKLLTFFPLSWITQLVIMCYSFEHPVIRIIPGRFAERACCKLIHDLRIDAALLGTENAMKLVHHGSLQDFDISCLKMVFVGGFTTSPSDMTMLRHAYGEAQVVQCYGITEMSCLVSAFSTEDYDTALVKPGSVGQPLPGVKVKIMKFDSKETIGPDWWGDLYLGGPTVMLGYFKDVYGTNAVIEKGYYKTGDVGQLDTDGYLYIQGRCSDHILTQGIRLVPSEVEELIAMHPQVKEVVVLGNDREVVACVIRHPNANLTTEKLQAYINELIPEGRRPTRIKFMDSFPKTNIGKDFDISCLKMVFVGGFTTSPSDMTMLRHAYGEAQVVQCYGITEMSCLVSAFSTEDYDTALVKPGSVGQPLPGVKVKIMKFDSKETIGPDWWGDLYLGGPTVMLGYFKDVYGTNAVIEKGYYKTGDVGQLDTDGYLYIQGRCSDHILTQGIRLVPSEVEELIAMHPQVKEVVVLGNDREVVACVIRHPNANLTTEKLQAYINELIPEGRRPTRIKFMDSFPKTNIGKVKRATIRRNVFGITIVHSKSVVSFINS